MPFAGEHASRDGYIRLAKDRSIEEKIAAWSRVGLPENLDQDLARHSRPLTSLPLCVPVDQVSHTVAVDGSPSEAGDDPDGTGSTVGVFVVGIVHTDRKAVEASVHGSFVDPAALLAARNEHTIHGVVPGARVALAGLTGQQTWRHAIDEFLFSQSVAANSQVSLADIYLAINGTPGRAARSIPLAACPECGERTSREHPLSVTRDGGQCPHCGCRLYLSDSLLLHHEFNEQESNWSPMTRLMNVSERIATAGVVQELLVRDPEQLSRTLVVTDGPLGVFGPQSALSRALGRFYEQVNQALANLSLPPLLHVGLEKSGQFVAHATRIGHLIEPGTAVLPSVDYIRNQILFRGSDKNLYGQHEFYGRRFFVKDTRGDLKVVTVLPTPGVNAYSALAASEDWDSYPTIGVVAALMERYRSAQYADAFLPSVEAHALASLPRGEGLRVMSNLANAALDRGTAQSAAAPTA